LRETDSNRIIYFDLRSKKTPVQLTSINHLEKQVYTNRWKRSSVWWHIFILPKRKHEKKSGECKWLIWYTRKSLSNML